MYSLDSSGSISYSKANPSLRLNLHCLEALSACFFQNVYRHLVLNKH